MLEPNPGAQSGHGAVWIPIWGRVKSLKSESSYWWEWTSKDRNEGATWVADEGTTSLRGEIGWGYEGNSNFGHFAILVGDRGVWVEDKQGEQRACWNNWNVVGRVKNETSEDSQLDRVESLNRRWT